MKRFLGIFVATLLSAIPLAARAEVNIFACEPEWAALAEEIGGNKVETFSATHANQDPHYIRARPSLIAKMRKANVLLCSGAGLEAGWLPLLLQKAGGEVQPGAVGHLMATDVVPVLEKPVTIDRSQGDVHPQGNPHVHLNPHNVLLVAKELTTRLGKIDAGNAYFYISRYQDFFARWQKAITNWEAKAFPLKGKPVVVHHKSFVYLLDWLGIQEVAALEPKPGISPTTSHLESLLRQMKNKPASLVLRTPYDPDDASQWLSKKTGIPVVVLPYTVGGDARSGNLFSLFGRTISLMTGTYDDQH